MSQAPTPRLGLIGIGPWGKNLARNFHKLGALVAVHDSDPRALDYAAATYPGVKTLGLDALLAEPGLDAVAIAAPAAAHGELVLRALASGKHVFVEKPLCLDLAQAETIRTAVARSGLCLMVGHLLLYHPAFVALQKALREGRIGSLRYVYSNRLSLGRIRREENSLWSFAPHDISMLLALAGELPTEVLTTGGAYLDSGVADTTVSHFKFAGELQAHIFVSWLHPYKDHRMVVIGSEGMIVFDDVQEGAQKLRFYAHRLDWNGEIPLVTKAEAQPVPYDAVEPLAMECAHFVDCVRRGARPTSNVDEGLRVLTVLDACQRSLETGGAVKLGAR